MAELWLRHPTLDTEQRHPLHEGTTLIGRGDKCDLRLPSARVSREHLSIRKAGDDWLLSSRGFNGTFLNGEPVPRTSPVALRSGDRLAVADFTLIFVEEGAAAAQSVKGEDLRARFFELERSTHQALLTRLDLRRFAVDAGQLEVQAERILSRLTAVVEEALATVDLPLKHYIVREAVKRELIGKLLFSVTENRIRALLETRRTEQEIQNEHSLQSMLKSMLRQLGVTGQKAHLSEDLETVERGFGAVFVPERYQLTPSLEEFLLRKILVRDIADLVFGLGPLQDLIDMTNITEIMVVNKDLIYVERGGILEKVDRSFISDNVVLSIIERIVTPLGRRIDRSSPLVDARLADGSRVNAIIPPLAIKGPAITIRKFAKIPLTVDDLVENRTLTAQAALFLEACVVGAKNIVISGGTGSGKTTLLNVLSGFIPPKQRIVTIEDAAELQLNQEHVVSLESRPANLEGKGVYTIRDLVRNALRMRPDRIIVGECRGGEALDMLQAMNTGHNGSMTTAHANSPRELVSRLETMVMMAGLELPSKAIREQIVGAIHLILQQDRLPSGTRRVSRLSEVVGLDEDGSVIVEDVFAVSARSGKLVPTGHLPSFVLELLQKRVIKLEEFF